MRDVYERPAVELSWDEVRNIVSKEIKKILGLQIQCKVNVVEDSFWDVTFTGYHLPLPKLCQLLQATQATPHRCQQHWDRAG